MLSFLKKAYPISNSLYKNVISNLLIGLFVAFFLMFFEPFGISQWKTEHKLIKLAGFGIVSFVIRK